MSKSSILYLALNYTKLGWAVIPIRPNAKTPMTPHGVLDASSDEDIVQKWSEEFPGANIAIATGTPSGIWVLDLDGAEGVAALKQLENDFTPIPRTPRVKTGNGEHVYFKYPSDAGEKLKNVARLDGRPIDVRTTGGYVVAPPSRHQNGHNYEWITTPDEVSPVPAPQWLLDLACQNRLPDRKNQQNAPLRMRVQTDADLSTAPGVKEGCRNSELCRLVGGHLRREDPVSTIEALALSWSQRCTPPLPAVEVTKTVHSLATKHDASSPSPQNPSPSFRSEELESIPLPDPPEWPQLESAAFHGLAGEIVTKLEPCTEADPVALLVQLLAMAGNVVGRAPRFQVEGDFHHTCLFVCLVGQTARGRKGTAKGRVGQILQECDPEWYEERMVSGLSSGEGLIYAVRDSVIEQEEVKEIGGESAVQDVIKDHGSGDRRLMVVEPEFGSVLRVMRRDGNPLSPVIRQFWDSGNVGTLTKHNPLKATDAHVGIVAHITRPELDRQLNAASLFDGFANRFLWPVVRRSKLLPDGGGDIALQEWITRMQKALATARDIGHMERSSSARELWHKVYPDLTAEKPSVVHDAVTSRSEAQVLRLSMIYALLDSSATIDVPHLEAALAIWDYCDQSAKLIFADAETEDPLAQKIREALEGAVNGLTRTEIHNATGRNYKAQVLVEKLAKLRDRGQIERRQPESGKPGPNPERWYLVKRSKNRKQTKSNSSYNSYSSSSDSTSSADRRASKNARPSTSTNTLTATLEAESATADVDDYELAELMKILEGSGIDE